MNAEHLLQTCNRPWVMKHHTELSQDVMAKAICLDGKEMTSIYGILTEFADKFKFPNYFGFNFNALNEMLRDLEWFPRSRYIVVILNGDYLLRDESEKLEWFLSFMSDVSEEWSVPVAQGEYWDRPAIPFHTIVQISLNLPLDDFPDENL